VRAFAHDSGKSLDDISFEAPDLKKKNVKVDAAYVTKAARRHREESGFEPLHSLIIENGKWKFSKADEPSLTGLIRTGAFVLSSVLACRYLFVRRAEHRGEPTPPSPPIPAAIPISRPASPATGSIADADVADQNGNERGLTEPAGGGDIFRGTVKPDASLTTNRPACLHITWRAARHLHERKAHSIQRFELAPEEFRRVPSATGLPGALRAPAKKRGLGGFEYDLQ